MVTAEEIEDAVTVIVDRVGRADALIAAAADGLSRTRVQSLIRAGAVELNGIALLDPSHRLAPGDEVTLVVPPPEPAEPVPEPIPLELIHEDDDVVVVDKPAGLVVHPAAGHARGTLVNALLHHCGPSLSGIGGIARPGIVHRLDKDTSGVMVVAKNDRAHRALAAQFADHGRTGPLRRRYAAVVWGEVSPASGTVHKSIGRHAADRQRFAVRGDGREAITHYRLAERLGPASLVRCELETGRTHQIRVHMAALGHPVLGDPVYATGFQTKANRLSPAARGALDALGRQALHAEHLAFAHPATGEVMAFDAPLPPDMAALVDALRVG